MGTTAEKLAYLKESKEQIKNALETPSNVMRDYANWIKKYVDNQPTSIVSDGVCTNALDVPLVSMGVDGNSEQNRYEGYNKLAPSDAKSTTISGITFSSDGKGKYSISGTATDNTQENFKIPNYTIQSGDYLQLKNVVIGGSLILLNETGSAQIINESIDIVDKMIDLSEKVGQTIGYIKFFYISGKTVNTEITPMIVNSSISKPFEPYVGGQPSPNPEYPQDIEVIDGANLFDIESWLTQNNINFVEKNDTFELEVNQSLYSNKFVFSDDNINVSLYGIIKNITSTNFRIDLLDKNNDIVSSMYSGLEKIENVNCSKLRFNFSSAGKVSLNKPMLVKGTTPKPYLPHGHIGLRQSGKNLIDYSMINTPTLQENGFYKIIFPGHKELFKGQFKEKVQYVISMIGYGDIDANSGGFDFHYTDGSKSSLRIQGTEQKRFVHKTDANKTIDYIEVTWGNKNTTYIKELQLEENTETPYEPYHSPKLYPINLNGNSIAKVGDVKDLLKVYRNGDVEIEKKIGKYVTTGNENLLAYRIATNGTFAVRCNLPTLLSINNKKGLCNKMIIKTLIELNNGDIGIGVHNDNYVYCNATGQASTLEDAQQFWQNNIGMEMHYNLATPETIKLPSIEPIQLWEGTNNFELITNLDTTFEMEYVEKV